MEPHKSEIQHILLELDTSFENDIVARVFCVKGYTGWEGAAQSGINVKTDPH